MKKDNQRIKYKLAQRLNYWFDSLPELIRPKFTESYSEQLFKNILVNLNVKFKQQVKINKFRVDFCVGKICIEIDDFHHEQFHRRRMDKERDKVLIGLGYKVHRIKAYKLFDNVENSLIVKWCLANLIKGNVK